MASLKKQANGSWQATIYMGRDVNGKQLFTYLTRPTWHECSDAAREVERERAEGGCVKIESVRVITALRQWIDLNDASLSPSTIALYNTYINGHFEPFFGHLLLTQLREAHIQRFKNEKLKTLSRSTVRRMLSMLKSALSFYMKNKSPAKSIKLPDEETYTPYVLTDDEMRQIHGAVQGTKDEPIILLAGWCGLRRGEIFALKPNDILLQQGQLKIDESYCLTKENVYVFKRPKSENGVRKVVAPAYLLNLLTRIVKDMMREGRMDDRLFPQRPDNFSSHFAKLIREKGLPPIRFHDLRHYHASWLYAQGIPDQYAAGRLGHDIKILKGIYQHLALNRQVAIDDRIRQLSPNGLPAQKEKTIDSL